MCPQCCSLGEVEVGRLGRYQDFEPLTISRLERCVITMELAGIGVPICLLLLARTCYGTVERTSGKLLQKLCFMHTAASVPVMEE